MQPVSFKYVVVGLGAADPNERVYCPEPGCGRGMIPFPDDPKFALGFESLKPVDPAGTFDLAGAIDFESEQDAKAWWQTSDGERWRKAYQLVMLIRHH